MSKLTIQSGSRNHFESAGTVLVIISICRDGSCYHF